MPKASLQLLDSNETLRQLRMVIGVPRGTLGCGLLDQSVYLVLILADNLGEGCNIAVREIQTVTHPVVGLLAGVVGADGGRRLLLSIGSIRLAPNNNLLRGRGAPVSARPFGER